MIARICRDQRVAQCHLPPHPAKVLSRTFLRRRWNGLGNKVQHASAPLREFIAKRPWMAEAVIDDVVSEPVGRVCILHTENHKPWLHPCSENWMANRLHEGRRGMRRRIAEPEDLLHRPAHDLAAVV
ncbi:hypothetical protein [Knoellia koreensis]|uniref:Uncharacterized protein n=1 Tax=Knoellia koreensis TaxID=2730921 RepID=A0A849H9Z6_9MICO|nr:hypothetical protein [Knoellia sp. DB2414S]NNM46690.1 hypothetical protein [Knoellia sp. DB2414S]